MSTEGIDVAWPQGAHFPWEYEHGKITFGMAKATEGTILTDPDFGHNWDSMWWLRPDHQLPRFAYHFFRAAEDPEKQAEHLVTTVKAHGLLPGDHFVLDLEETVSGSGENDAVPAARCAPLAVRCLRKVNELAPGHRILPYMNPSWARTGGSAGMASWYLWIADYGVQRPAVPAPWKDWTFWQCGDSPADTDVFNGDEAALLEFCRMPATR